MSTGESAGSESEQVFFPLHFVSITENHERKTKGTRVQEMGKAMWKKLPVELGKWTLCFGADGCPL